MSNLKELVNHYCVAKTFENDYKKAAAKDNEQIKIEMSKMNISEVKTDEYQLNYTVQKSDNFDEEKLIDKLMSLTYRPKGGSFANVCVGTGLGIVKRKPYVDMEALENAIYEGYINPADLADCKIIKETPKITFKKVKKNE